MARLLAKLLALFVRTVEQSRLDRIVEEAIERCVIDGCVVVVPPRCHSNAIVWSGSYSILSPEALEAEFGREMETPLTGHGAPEGWN